MRSHYGEPSGDFTIILTKDELHRLESTGHLGIHTPEIPCTADRLVWNPDKQDMDIVDKRDIESDGLLLLDYVGGEIGSEKRYIQFLNIRIEDKKNDCDICQIDWRLPNYTLTHPDGRSYEGMSHFCPKCGRYMGMLGRYAGNC